MKIGRQYIILFVLTLTACWGCRVVKMGQFYLSENHQRPKQDETRISSDSSRIFRFSSSTTKHQKLISNISYTPYSKGKKKSFGLSEYLDKETRTTAFLVIRKDTILFEEYYENYNEYSLLPSWSIAKSFTSALVGIAIQEGYISKSDKVTEYFPELSKHSQQWNQLSIEHLLNMRSGIDFDEEDYVNPFSSVADLYVSKDIMSLLRKVRFKCEPGKEHYYSSLDTEILSLILEKTIDRSLSSYLQEKIWHPLGMESSATWSVDSKKTKRTKSFCCLNITLRDYAKFARLYLNRGNWNGNQVIDSTWISESVIPNFSNNCYQNQWYSQKSYEFSRDLSGNYQISTFADSISAQKQIENDIYQTPKKHWDEKGEWVIQNCGPEFYALGIFGQEILVDPEREMIFIRLGKRWDTSSINIFSIIKKEIENYER